jgi:hypothetical protein
MQNISRRKSKREKIEKRWFPSKEDWSETIYGDFDEKIKHLYEIGWQICQKNGNNFIPYWH